VDIIQTLCHLSAYGSKTHGSAKRQFGGDSSKTEDELKSLDEVSQLPREYPERMLATQGADRLGPVDLGSKSVDQK
jgi:hypothetical protein